MEEPRQLAGAAAEIDDAHVGRRADERQEIEERLFALTAKSLVLSGIPGVELHECFDLFFSTLFFSFAVSFRFNKRQPVRRQYAGVAAEIMHADAEQPNRAPPHLGFVQ